jgi:hypothetical protein
MNDDDAEMAAEISAEVQKQALAATGKDLVVVMIASAIMLVSSARELAHKEDRTDYETFLDDALGYAMRLGQRASEARRAQG